MAEQQEREGKPFLTSEYDGRDQGKLDAIKAWALKTLDDRRQAELDEVFHVDPTFARDNPEKAARLKARFMADKKKLYAEHKEHGTEPNMGDMFNLSLEYFGLIGVVKLAETNHDQADESLRLKAEFEDLMHWFSGRGVAVDKLSRPASKRWFNVEQVGQLDDGNDGYRTVIHRTRPLVHTEIIVEGDEGVSEPAELTIFKETVFSLPTVVFAEIMSSLNAAGEPAGQDGYAWSERQKSLLENYLYGNNDSHTLQRINTAYFSALIPPAQKDRFVEGDGAS